MGKEARPLSASASPQGIRKGELLPPTTRQQDRGNPFAASPQDRVGIGRFALAWLRSSCRPPLGSKTHPFHGNGVGRATIHAQRAADAAILILQYRRVVCQLRQPPRLIQERERDNL